MREPNRTILRFGVFELDPDAEQLLKEGRVVRLPPQPFRLLCLLVARGGRLVSREEIRAALWEADTFVDFDQGVNFAIKQIREALQDEPERSVYIQTVPRRGYRFVAPVEVVGGIPARAPGATADLRLHKALWANIVELRLAEEGRKKRRKLLMLMVILVGLGLAALLLIRMWLA